MCQGICYTFYTLCYLIFSLSPIIVYICTNACSGRQCVNYEPTVILSLYIMGRVLLLPRPQINGNNNKYMLINNMGSEYLFQNKNHILCVGNLKINMLHIRNFQCKEWFFFFLWKYFLCLARYWTVTFSNLPSNYCFCILFLFYYVLFYDAYCVFRRSTFAAVYDPNWKLFQVKFIIIIIIIIIIIQFVFIYMQT
jgi:hypothetical protein